MKLLLHIGTEKTGTTSTQRWGHNNRDALIRQGVFYSKVLGDVNHRKISLWALDPATRDEGWAAAGLHTPAQRDRFRATLSGALADEIARARALGCHTFLISNEHCQSRLRTSDSLQRLHGLLIPLFDTVEILCCLRPQIDVAVSLASTLARGYQRIDRTMFSRVTATRQYYNYQQLHQNWAAVFGDRTLTFVAFRKHPDLVRYIIRALDLDATALPPAARFNEALDVRVMALVNVLADGRKNPKSDTVFATLPFDHLPCSEKLQPGIDIARRVQARFARSNARLAAQRPEIDARDLEPDWSRYDAPPNLGLLDRTCVFSDQLGAALAIADQRVALAQAREKLAEIERAVTREKFPEAIRFLTQARALLDKFPAQHTFVQQTGRISARLDNLETKVPQTR